MSSRIEDYAIIGDCLTCALVAKDGSIDWLCLPRFDSPACFAALLGDDSNGRWLLAPASGGDCPSRRYRGAALALESTWQTPEGTVRVIDLMPPRGQAADVVRIIEGVSGRVRMQLDLTLRFDYGHVAPWVRRVDGEFAAMAGPDAVWLRTPVQLEDHDRRTTASFDVGAGDRVPFVLTYAASPLPRPTPLDADRPRPDTEPWWAAWVRRCSYDGEWSADVRRSLLTLKALSYAPTGGIVAAATTSLPEQLGGSRNWDYRYCWLRDATFTLLALINSGYTEEASAWHSWLLRAVAGAPANRQIMYGIMGQRRLLEWEVPWLAGYEGALPVRIGNAAHAQLQLDVYGELIDAFHQWRVADVKLDEGTWAIECQVLEHLAEVWDQPDHGIWERRGNSRHYVSSKVLT